MRALAASQVTEDLFDIIRNDVMINERVAIPDLETLRSVIMTPGVWGSHSALVLLLRGFSLILGENIGAVVVIENSGNEPLIVTFDDQIPGKCICLHYCCSQTHYRLLSEFDECRDIPRVVFDLEEREFIK
jgi:hypothetical protein